MITLDDQFGRLVGQRNAGAVRRDDDVRVVPEWMIVWQRFLSKDIQHRAAGPIAIQCIEQILLDQVLAAADVDQRATCLHLREQSCSEDVARFFGQRQQVDQEVACIGDFVEAFGA